jgi:hypothetical protein
MDGAEQLFCSCGIELDDNGYVIEQEIPRDTLLSSDLYAQLQSVISLLKISLSSSSMTSLQSSAGAGQKWPLVNLVRQVLKQLGYRMQPIRRSLGRLQSGKKRYVRSFRITGYTSGAKSVKLHGADNN